MITIVLITFFGILVGYLLRGFSAVREVNRTVTWTIWLMLFVLGLSVGRNPLIVTNLGRFGGEALLISVASVLGSVAAAAFVQRFIRRKGEDEG